MIAGETEMILHEDFDDTRYDPESMDDGEYDDFWIFSSKAKRAERKAKRTQRKASRIAKRTARRSAPARVARKEKTQRFLSSLGGAAGLGSAIDALVTKPVPKQTQIDAPEDLEMSFSKGQPQKEDGVPTSYIIAGGVLVVGVVGLLVMQSRKNQY